VYLLNLRWSLILSILLLFHCSWHVLLKKLVVPVTSFGFPAHISLMTCPPANLKPAILRVVLLTAEEAAGANHKLWLSCTPHFTHSVPANPLCPILSILLPCLQLARAAEEAGGAGYQLWLPCTHHNAGPGAAGKHPRGALGEFNVLSCMRRPCSLLKVLLRFALMLLPLCCVTQPAVKCSMHA
jgi:hypothetical protein